MVEKSSRALKVTLFDVDGTLVTGPMVQLAAVQKYRKIGNKLYSPPNEIKILQRATSSAPLSIRERLSLATHQIRRVYPGAKEAITTSPTDQLFGISTGRHDHVAWRNITERSLRMGGILERMHFSFYGLPGVSTTLSKISSVLETEALGYKVVKFVDDNPANVLPLAEVFQDIHVVIVRDLTTDFLLRRVDWHKYPNVSVVDTIKQSFAL